MPGNEIAVCKFLVERLNRLNLPHIGTVTEVIIPGGLSLSRVEDCVLIHPDDAWKKADILLNGKGVSIKQKGATFSFNRLQRADLDSLFMRVQLADAKGAISRLDQVVNEFHAGRRKRDVDWTEVFQNRSDFYKLLEHLMMQGSPSSGLSAYPAELILEAPAYNISEAELKVFTFEEYFQANSSRLKVSIRRQWMGQDSCEHNRAVSIASNPGNAPWVFGGVAGRPRSGWKLDVPISERKTVYFLMISKT
jgi:hypothetical protein